jgi:hypothetical protein
VIVGQDKAVPVDDETGTLSLLLEAVRPTELWPEKVLKERIVEHFIAAAWKAAFIFDRFFDPDVDDRRLGGLDDIDKDSGRSVEQGDVIGGFRPGEARDGRDDDRKEQEQSEQPSAGRQVRTRLHGILLVHGRMDQSRQPFPGLLKFQHVKSKSKNRGVKNDYAIVI